MAKFFAFFIIIAFYSQILFSQSLMTLSLNDAYSLLEARYPVLQNDILFDQIYQKELQQLDIAQKPSIEWKADGRFQSESTKLEAGDAPLPFEINQPLVNIRTFVEANYILLDGGIYEAQRKLKTAQLQVEKQNLEVDKFELRARINQLFVGIEVMRAQVKIFDISLLDLATRKERIEASIEMGVLLPSELSKIEVKALELKAQRDNIIYQIEGMINSLGQLIGKELPIDVNLSFPTLPALTTIPELNRPEQELFKIQREAILAQSDIIDTQKNPKISAYAQAGLGYPNPLNILDNSIAPYGIIGARFSMPITDWKKTEVDRELLSLQAQKLINAEATLEFNLNTKKANYLATIKRINAQIQREEEIAKLQTQILEQLAVQLDEGIITSADYITQVNAELKSRQNLAIYKTQLLKTQLEFLNERGAF